jgi:uncharacterized SAM-binding protein YcdF (DUF218 family)
MGRHLLSADAIVVLGGGIDALGRPTSSSLRRLSAAIELFDRSIAPRLVFSGRWSNRLTYVPPCTEAEAMRQFAIESGVPADRIHLEEHSGNTIANAYYCKQDIIEPLDFRRVALVTSPTHMPRSRFLFEQVLGSTCEVIPVPTNEPIRYDPAEQAGLLALQNTLREVRPGDHQTIARLLLAQEVRLGVVA